VLAAFVPSLGPPDILGTGDCRSTLMEAAASNASSRAIDPAPDLHAPIDRRDVYRLVVRIANTAGIRRHINPS